MNSYDADAHIYRAPMGRLPGATDVIKSAGLVATEWLSEDARWRGKCVHRGIELINKGELDWDTVDELVAGYLRSYEAFLTVTGFVVYGSETPCFEDAFGCLPDLWGGLNRVNAVVELKTGPVPKWTALQTALQARALRRTGFYVGKRFGLRLMADGSLAKLESFDDPADDRVAMGLVDAFHWRLRNGYIKDWQ